MRLYVVRYQLMDKGLKAWRLVPQSLDVDGARKREEFRGMTVIFAVGACHLAACTLTNILFKRLKGSVQLPKERTWAAIAYSLRIDLGDRCHLARRTGY